jgi:uncharacterized protein
MTRLPAHDPAGRGILQGTTFVNHLVGAALFAEAYPTLKGTLLRWGNLGKITLPEVLGVNHWVLIVLFVAGGLLLFRWFEKKNL